MTLDTFIATAQIRMTATRTDSNPAMQNSGSMDHWRCILWAGRSRMTVTFSMGYGLKGAEPTAHDVLSCLAADASSADQDFDSWASDLGFDVDSRQAHKTYTIIVQQASKLRRLLGDSAYDTLINHVERD